MMMIAKIKIPMAVPAAIASIFEDSEIRFVHSSSVKESMRTVQELSTLKTIPRTRMTCSPAVHCSIKPASCRLEACSVPCSVPL